MLGTIVTMAFVVATLAVVAYALFEITPFAHHADRFTSAASVGGAPHLD